MIIQEVNFNPLFTWISKQLKIYVDHLSIEFNDNKRPTLLCPNLVDDSGIFRSVVKEVTVDFFNFDFNEGTGNLWATIYLNYESWSGGSNGMQIGTVWFNPETGWTFESCKEKFQKYNDQ